ncbi:MAG: hypothetical protein Q7U16_14565 [Agitococcus sp.]|nr:hypothetical protein [Agitococcus sp.]
MSNYGSTEAIWVGDLDGYISINAIDNCNRLEEEKEWRAREFDSIGDISLLSGKSIRLNSMLSKKLEPSEWRWAVHQAEISLSVHASGKVLEKELIRALIDLGRAYAVARYARWEKIPHPSALTASLPLGFRALLSQYLSGEGLLAALGSRERIWITLKAASKAESKVAYQRVGQVQALIHGLAYDALGQHGPVSLRRNSTRTILSLARLHYSVEELRLDDFTDVARLFTMYALAREADEEGSHIGRYISNWRLRHLRPLTDLFPYSIRDALDRGVCHVASGVEIQREIAVNELALAHSGVLLMRKRS